MDVTTLIAVLVWLLVGFGWARYWYNDILIDHRYSDTGQEAGPFMLFFQTIFGPVFLAIGLLMIAGDAVMTKTGPFIKKVYGN